MEGEQLWGDFGASLASLDFNGDGYEELGVTGRGTTAENHHEGFEIYYGSKILLLNPDIVRCLITPILTI